MDTLHNMGYTQFKGETMAHAAFDTLKYAKALEEAGVPKKQAEAFAVVQNQALNEALDSGLATKADIENLATKMDGKFNLLYWMFGVLVAGVASIVIKTFF